MLIVEGPDCVGKTTLCMQLLDRLPQHVYAHFSRLPSQFDYYWGYVDRISRFVVQDRFHMSELAYAAARGERPGISPQQYRMLDAVVRLVGGLTVLVTADDELIRDRHSHDVEMYDTQTVHRANEEFRRFGENSCDYEVDVDWYRHCTPACPFVTDDDVDEVVAMYLERQGLVDRLLSRAQRAGVTSFRPASIRRARSGLTGGGLD